MGWMDDYLREGQDAISSARLPQPRQPSQTPYDVARSQMGKHERKDEAALRSFLYDGGKNLSPTTRAWCADFVNASVTKAGGQGTGSGMARSFLNWGDKVDKPQRGDVAVFSRGGPNSGYGHVGFFDGYDGTGSVRVLGGNQSDRVGIQAYPASRVLGFRRGPAAPPSQGFSQPGEINRDGIIASIPNSTPPVAMPPAQPSQQFASNMPVYGQEQPQIQGARFREAGSYPEYTMGPNGKYVEAAGPAPGRYIIPASDHLTADLTAAHGAGFQRMMPNFDNDGAIKAVYATQGQPRWMGKDPTGSTDLARIPQAGEFLSKTYGGQPNVLAGSRYDDGTASGAIPAPQPQQTQVASAPPAEQPVQASAANPTTADHWPVKTIAEAAPAKPNWQSPMAVGAPKPEQPATGTSSAGTWPVKTIAQADPVKQPKAETAWWGRSNGADLTPQFASDGMKAPAGPKWDFGSKDGMLNFGGASNPFAKLFKGF